MTSLSSIIQQGCIHNHGPGVRAVLHFMITINDQQENGECMGMNEDNYIISDSKGLINKNLLRWLEIVLVLLIVFSISTITLSAANPATNPPGRDGGFFNYVGKVIESGSKLYVDIWDSKGPMIFWINALGVGADYTRWGVFFIELCFETASLFITYWVVKKLFGFLPALGTVLIGALLLKLVIATGNSTEEYSILFTWVAVLALTMLLTMDRMSFWSFFLMGSSIVFNFLLRANNIGTQIIVILVALSFVHINRKETKLWQPVAYLIIGALIIAVPVSLHFIINGSFKAMIDASILYNFSYSTAANAPFFDRFIPAINVFNKWILVFLAIWVLSIWHLLDRKHTELTPILWLTILAFPMEVLMSSVSGRGYVHYYICWMPACMLLIAYGLSVVQKEAINPTFRQKCETNHTLMILVGLILIIAGTSFNTVYFTPKFVFGSMLHPSIKREFQEPVARVVMGLTDDTDKVLVFAGQAGINLMSQRDSIDGALFYPAINNSRIGLEVQEKFFMNLRADPPQLILDGYSLHPEQIPAIDPKTRNDQRFLMSFSNNLEQVMSWINQHYERYDEANGYIIYRLRSISQ